MAAEPGAKGRERERDKEHITKKGMFFKILHHSPILNQYKNPAFFTLKVWFNGAV